jgi:hypothetical protein
MAYAMRMRYISEESVHTFFSRAFSLAVGVDDANEALKCHLSCQKCHPLYHYDINSKKPVSKPVFDSQPI